MSSSRVALVFVCFLLVALLLAPVAVNAQETCRTTTQAQNVAYCSEYPNISKTTLSNDGSATFATGLSYHTAGILQGDGTRRYLDSFDGIEESHSDGTANEEDGEGEFTVNPTSSTYQTVYGGTLDITVEVVNQADYTARQDINFFIGGEGPLNQARRIDSVRDLELDGGEATTVTFSYNVPEEPNSNWPSDNEFDLRVTATDGEGVLGLTDSTWRPVSVEEVEVPPPNAEFSYTPTPPIINTPIQFDASDSFARAGTLESYEWEMGDGTEISGVSLEHKYEEYGEYEVSLTVSDGENEDTVTKTLIVENIPPKPIFEFGTQSDDLTVDDEISVNAFNSYDPDGDEIEEYRWGFGDGTSKQGSRVSHSYSDPGTYNLTLTVDDGIKTAVNSTRINIINRPPEASIYYSPEDDLTVGETITFDASNSSDPDGDVDRYVWRLGNGETARGEVVEHSYEELGTYNVVLTVDDGGKTDEEEITFTVGPGEESADGFGAIVFLISLLTVTIWIKDRRNLN
mgnify:CR=1 FL=1